MFSHISLPIYDFLFNEFSFGFKVMFFYIFFLIYNILKSILSHRIRVLLLIMIFFTNLTSKSIVDLTVVMINILIKFVFSNQLLIQGIILIQFKAKFYSAVFKLDFSGKGKLGVFFFFYILLFYLLWLNLCFFISS